MPIWMKSSRQNLKYRRRAAEQRVTVGMRGRHRLGGNRTAGARSIFHDDLLTQAAGHLLANHARDDVE
jgi:hypothetical protein